MKTMNMSDQAVGAVMMALQKSLLEQSDITETLQKMEFVPASDGGEEEPELYVKNPPIVKFDNSVTSENGE